ncbi:MAG: response regulator [Pseudomonadota bacterium]|nr:response regulator [Pseudomonadota bacterium]
MLHVTERDILTTNLLVSLGLAVGLLLPLCGLTGRVTTPLKNLATIMRRASQGEKQLRAELRGPRDIIEMEQAFNTMMAVLQAREGQLEEARDAAIESARVKGEFAANVSHELRTPLGGVLGMLELLQGTALTSKQRDYLEVANQAGKALLVLIEDILDFSRIESGKLKLQPVDFCLREILDEVVAMLARQAQRKAIDLNYVVADQVPSTVRGEPSRIRQVLINLVGNAVKFTAQGEVAIRVSKDSDRGSKTLLRFEVKDTGIGIPIEAHRRIFEAFTQADGSTTRNYGGSGLGLAISRQLVAFMGGDVGLASELGQGSTFWFTVALDQSASVAERLTNAERSFNGLRVLIVDDSEVVRAFIAQTLGGWGIEYLNSTASARQALEMLRSTVAQGSPYDLAIVDDSLPGTGGTELVDNIAADPALAELKVILTTNEQQPPGIWVRPPMARCLRKPIRASELYDCIAAAINPSDDYRSPLVLHSETETPMRLGGRILVVEDNRANQLVAMGMLERLGCQVEIASDGQQALAQMARQAFDLLLMDCQMPGMDGYEAARRIRAIEQGSARIPIIAMTANVQPSDRDKCLASGMDDYLPKPLTLQSLHVKLAQWLDPITQDAGISLEGGTASGDAAIDRAILDEVRDSVGGGFPRVVQYYLEDMPGHLRSLEAAVANGDVRLLGEIAHNIKGSSRTLGAHRLAANAKQLEDIARGGATEGTTEWVTALFNEYKLVKLALDQELQQRVQQGASREVGQARILIVDDDRSMRAALRALLETDGHRMEEAAHGLHALALCERQMPDLVLMDAMMPEMDGFMACRRMREFRHGERIPILIITALDDESSIDGAFAAGATDYISKPINFAVLRQRVSRLLQASRAEAHVRRLAYQDSLTGLPNRTLFKERLEVLIGRSSSDQLHAILFLDLNRFKLVNDTLGHEVGDLLLKAAAERLSGCVRSTDTVARIGGDEFTIILEHIDSLMVVTNVVEKISKALATPFVFVGQEMYVSTSIGVSVYPVDGKDCGSLIKRADIAMFKAKEHGDRFRFYEDSMDAGTSKRLALESDLRRAIEREELILHYQPQIDLGSGRIIGMEALVRWQHPMRGMISPAHFIPLAEETGLIAPLGEWVLGSACAQNKAWQDAGLRAIPVAVNLSAKQLGQNDLDRSIAKILDDTGLQPRFLELELTETAVMHKPEEMLARLRSLKDLGIHISLDDFGTGYSSLNYLKHFPFDKLKIDQCFVRGVISNPDDAAIVLTIINIACSLKLRVIAEGVETKGQLRYLQVHGCHEIQGYYFSRPIVAEEAFQLLQQDKGLPRSDIEVERILLLVDDETDVTRALERKLGNEDYKILTANSAKEAFELLAQHGAQVVISDQRMPEMDGIEFLSRIKDLYPGTVRMMLTAYSESTSLMRAINDGWIYKFISKPWKEEQLREQIREAFAEHGRREKYKRRSVTEAAA